MPFKQEIEHYNNAASVEQMHMDYRIINENVRINKEVLNSLVVGAGSGLIVHFGN